MSIVQGTSYRAEKREKPIAESPLGQEGPGKRMMLPGSRSHEHGVGVESRELNTLLWPTCGSWDMERGGTARQELKFEPVLEISCAGEITRAWKGVTLALLLFLLSGLSWEHPID